MTWKEILKEDIAKKHRGIFNKVNKRTKAFGYVLDGDEIKPIYEMVGDMRKNIGKPEFDQIYDKLVKHLASLRFTL